MPGPLLLDLSHTSHTRARTGVQRVTRSLLRALGPEALAITHDPSRRAWRTLERWERANLHHPTGEKKRGAHWPLAARLRGHAGRLLRRRPDPLPANAGLLVPEIFSAAVGRALPELFAQVTGPRVAVFHDAIALQLPELTPAPTVARFPAYLIELLRFDGIAAVSEDSRLALLAYWRWLGATEAPPVQAIALGVDPPCLHPMSEKARPPAGAPAVLSVGSIEGRKNHLALLEACEKLWTRGLAFELHLIGLAHRETGRAALVRIRELQRSGHAVRYDGPVGDAALAAAYAACAFTVYPSLREGFGLPVIESLAHGRPCVCSAHGALGESARGGGCRMVETVDAAGLAAAMAELLTTPARLAALAAEARGRRFRDWAAYAADLTAWARGLARRNQPLNLQ